MSRFNVIISTYLLHCTVVSCNRFNVPCFVMTFFILLVPSLHVTYEAMWMRKENFTASYRGMEVCVLRMTEKESLVSSQKASVDLSTEISFNFYSPDKEHTFVIKINKSCSP